jgi:hypothetical protein
MTLGQLMVGKDPRKLGEQWLPVDSATWTKTWRRIQNKAGKRGECVCTNMRVCMERELLEVWRQ